MQSQYIQEVGKYTALASLEFTATVIAGYYTARNQNASFDDIPDNSESFTQCATGLFLHNLRIGLTAAEGGYGFGAFPFYVSAVNGYMLGYNYYLLAKKWGHNTVLNALLPHGVLEIPALMVFCGIGFKNGIDIYHYALGQSVPLQENFMQSIELILYLAVALLIAAFIEVFYSKEDKLWQGKFQIYQGCII